MIWEERWHPLREEWVVIAAHRQDRPWTGEIASVDQQRLPKYVADCYLCPGNQRVSGNVNPSYEQIFVFDNDHPSVAVEPPEIQASQQLLSGEAGVRYLESRVLQPKT